MVAELLNIVPVMWLVSLLLVLHPCYAQEDVRQQVRLMNQEVLSLYQAGKYSSALEKAIRVLAIAEKAFGPKNLSIGPSLNNLAELHRATGAYEKALPLAMRALAMAEESLGPEHPSTGAILGNLAGLYQAMGQYDKALPLSIRALEIAGKAFGSAHPSAASSMTNLAELYRAMGSFEKALPLSVRALAIVEQARGAEDPSNGTFLNNLAGIYQSMGKNELALPLYVRALAIVEKRLGPEHPATGTSLNNLAELYQAMGEYDKAMPLSIRALTISESAEGSEHPSTGIRLNNLAGLYKAIGLYEKALPLYERALTISEKTNGPWHPSTGNYLNNLALLYEAMAAYEKALPLYARALAIAERTEGPEHPSTGISLNNLAELHRVMGAYEKALPLYQRALAIAEKSLGSMHAATGAHLNNMAVLYKDMGAYDKALPLYERALAIAEKTEGPEHPSTAIRLSNLGLLYKEMGAPEKALPLYQRALTISEKALGAEHPAVGIRLNNLANVHETMGAHDKALPLYVRTVKIFEKTLGPEHMATGTAVNNLASLHFAMDAYAEALPLYVRALSIAEKALGPEHRSTGTRLNNLASVYFELAEFDKALPLFQRGYAIAISRDGDPELLAKVAGNLCRFHSESRRTEAIFYCKFAVNTRQSQRIASKKLPGDLQQSFAKNSENIYFLLNRLLIQARRSTEAAQVLRALKDAEFSEFASGQAITKTQIDLTPSEANLNSLLSESAAKLQPLLAKQEALRKARAGPAELDELERPIQVQKEHLYAAFAQTPILLKSSDEEAKLQFKLDNNLFVKHLTNLNVATPGEKNAIIVITASSQRTQISTFYEREALQLDLPIAKDKLAQLVAAMQAGIVARTDTWRAPASELYALLIAPVEAQLAARQFSPQNLSFVISGEKLDIPPLAALLDANGQFLISKYRIGLYNPSSSGDVLQDWKKNWDITAFGSTKGHAAASLPALPQVENELAKIVRNGTGAQGALPGEKYLNQQFTRQMWGQSIANNASRTKRRVLHVATHFQIDINQHQSKLLMGDGQFYSAAEIAAEPGLPLSPIDLVTLSACSTAQRKSGNGSTFEGLGALFQYKGANAVLGTLWAVADGSTAELMQRFYANRGEQRKMSKAQALQEAQMAMLLDKKWRHPYYWAGFVLMGNWL